MRATPNGAVVAIDIVTAFGKSKSNVYNILSRVKINLEKRGHYRTTVKCFGSNKCRVYDAAGAHALCAMVPKATPQQVAEVRAAIANAVACAAKGSGTVAVPLDAVCAEEGDNESNSVGPLEPVRTCYNLLVTIVGP